MKRQNTIYVRDNVHSLLHLRSKVVISNYFSTHLPMDFISKIFGPDSQTRGNHFQGKISFKVTKINFKNTPNAVNFEIFHGTFVERTLFMMGR